MRVAQNNCIYLGRDKHYYSVLYTFIGQEVDVVYTRTLVKVYHKGTTIATHKRTVGFGYTTEKDHLCSTHRHYRDRSPQYYIKAAGKYSETLGLLVEKIFEGADSPEVLYKRCEGLLGLSRKTAPPVFEKVCRLALEHGIYTYSFVKNALQNKTYNKTDENKGIPLPGHQNIRGRDYFR